MVGLKRAIYESLWLLCLFILAVDLSACNKFVGKGTINGEANAAGIVSMKQVSITAGQNASSASSTVPTYQGFGLSNLTAGQDGSSTQSAAV